MSSTADNLLMERVRDGDVDKLGILFERYHKILYNFFLRLTYNRGVSEDLVQEVFFRMLKYRETYLGKNKFTTWMYTIARNTHIDHFRKNKREIPMNNGMSEPISKSPLPDEHVGKAQEHSLLRAAIAKLPLKRREVLVLSRFHGLKYNEIAQLLGCRVGTVKVHVHRAMKELGKIYNELSGGKAS